VHASEAAPVVFAYESEWDENGVLYYLGSRGKKESFRNPMGRGEVVVSSSGVGFGRLEDFVGRQFVNLRTRNEPDSFLAIDLREDRCLIVTDYVLRGRNLPSHALCSWELQGSVDGIEWQTIDRVYECDRLRQPSAAAHFTVDPSHGGDAVNAAFRCVRLVQIGKNSSGSHNLVLSGMELYGKAVGGRWP